jgi:hypothetical protein
MVTLRGTVFDSLTLRPLRNARITLTAADTVRATTDSTGGFVVSLQTGVWRATIQSPRLDSLRVPLPPHQVTVAPKSVVTLVQRVVARAAGLRGEQAPRGKSAPAWFYWRHHGSSDWHSLENYCRK